MSNATGNYSNEPCKANAGRCNLALFFPQDAILREFGGNKKKLIITLIGGFVILVGIVGIGFITLVWLVLQDPPDLYTRTKPTDQELIGSWRITAKSLWNLKDFQKKSPDWEYFIASTFFEEFTIKENKCAVIPIKEKYVCISALPLHYRNNMDSIVGQWEVRQIPHHFVKGDSIYELQIRVDYYDNNTVLYKINIDRDKETNKVILWDQPANPTPHVQFEKALLPIIE